MNETQARRAAWSHGLRLRRRNIYSRGFVKGRPATQPAEYTLTDIESGETLLTDVSLETVSQYLMDRSLISGPTEDYTISVEYQVSVPKGTSQERLDEIAEEVATPAYVFAGAWEVFDYGYEVDGPWAEEATPESVADGAEAYLQKLAS